MTFLASLKWKREYKSDSERFEKPFIYTLQEGRRLTLHQKPFQEPGFASTVWDSSIVISKLFERHPEHIQGRRCLDLSAGCGLVACVLSHLHPNTIVATDLLENLPLLKQNCEENAEHSIQVVPYRWGEPLDAVLNVPFDLVIACDVLYDHTAVRDLVSSLERLIKEDSAAWICCGRNGHAEEAFLRFCEERFDVSRPGDEIFDPDFFSEDISCFVLKKLH